MICHIVKITKKHNSAWYNGLIGHVLPVIKHTDNRFWVVCEVDRSVSGFKPLKKPTAYLITKSSCKIIGSIKI
jgi:hypothetical protein